jgi:hypothetical protein
MNQMLTAPTASFTLLPEAENIGTMVKPAICDIKKQNTAIFLVLPKNDNLFTSKTMKKLLKSASEILANMQCQSFPDNAKPHSSVLSKQRMPCPWFEKIFILIDRKKGPSAAPRPARSTNNIEMEYPRCLA